MLFRSLAGTGPQKGPAVGRPLFRGGRDQSGDHGVYRAAVCGVFWAVFPHRPPDQSHDQLGGYPGLCGRGTVRGGGGGGVPAGAGLGGAGGISHPLFPGLRGPGQPAGPGLGGPGPGVLRPVGPV